MSNRHNQFINKKKVKSIKCDWLLLLGERANGKSYCAKSIAIESAITKGDMFIYLKRYDLETKDSLCVSYFADMPIQEMTKGEYTTIDVFRKGIYLANVDPETGKTIRGKKIGLCHSLSASEHYKSLQFPEVNTILYEEVISMNGQYLYNEPDMLQQYVSSIFRRRKGKVIMIANKISRICPYYSAWNLDVASMKNGQVKHFIQENDNGDDTDIAVYLTESFDTNSGMFFGHAAKNITKGGYEVQPQPRLPEDIKEYRTIYKCVLKYDNIMFLMSLLCHNSSGEYTWYVCPKTTALQKNTRIISNEFSTSPLHTNLLRGITENEQYIFNMLRSGKVCFSDDLTGTEFNNLLPKFLSLK